MGRCNAVPLLFSRPPPQQAVGEAVRRHLAQRVPILRRQNGADRSRQLAAGFRPAQNRRTLRIKDAGRGVSNDAFNCSLLAREVLMSANVRSLRSGRGRRVLGSQARGLGADLRQLYRFMSPARRRNFLAVLALMLLGAVAELAAIGAVVPFLSLLAGQGEQPHLPWISGLLEALGAHGREQQLVAASLLFMAAAVIAGALRLQLAWSTQKFVLSLGHELAVEIQRRTLAQPYAYHVSRNSSEIIASLEKVQVLVMQVLLQLMQAVTAAFIALFIIAALVRIDPFTAAVAAVAFGALYALVTMLTRKRLARNSAIVGAAYQHRVQIIQESLGGIRDVIIDDSQAVYLDEFRKIDRRFGRARATTTFIGTAPRFIIEAAGMVVIAALGLAIAD